MLAYRHGFHAGGPADLLKHAVLLWALRHATAKPRPLFVLDAFAGAGLYDLEAPMAAKTGEFRAGIARLLAAPGPVPALLAPLVEQVRRHNPDGRLRWYPGSAELAAALLRPADRLLLVERHPSDHRLLAARCAGRPGVRVVRGDGLVELVAALPPPERRAVVLIDPSYELASDAAAVTAALRRALRRFATGVYLLWYPVLERARTESFLAGLSPSGAAKLCRLELCTLPDGAARGLTGSGLLVVNPPWTLKEAAEAALAWLARALGCTGPRRVDWVEAAAPSAPASGPPGAQR